MEVNSELENLRCCTDLCIEEFRGYKENIKLNNIKVFPFKYIAKDIDATIYKGAISGTAKNLYGRVMIGCFVGLYEIELREDNKIVEVLLSATKTNNAGQFIFKNILKGKYILKAM